ncbi:MAG: hypothetical protein HN576_07630 [Bacteriovoracaceae bacterium]|jgi:hypothetical protein|nr:hypothetical protein [Bacteriovoracaceae bacterium]
MKNLLFVCAILFTISCGKSNEVTAEDPILNPNNCIQSLNHRGQYRPYGARTTAIRANCIPQQRGATSWQIKTKFKKFPAKVRVKINGAIVADECSRNRAYPGRVTRARTGSEATIFIPSFQAPLNGRVQVELVKLGKKCFWWSSFYYQGNTRFTVGNVSTSRPAAVEILLPQGRY